MSDILINTNTGEKPNLEVFSRQLLSLEIGNGLFEFFREKYNGILLKKIIANQTTTKATIIFNGSDSRQTLWIHQAYKIFNPSNNIYPLERSCWLTYVVEKLGNLKNRNNPFRFIFPKFFNKECISSHHFGVCIFKFAVINTIGMPTYLYVPSITCHTRNNNIVTEACLENFFKKNKLFQTYKDQIAFIGYKGKSKHFNYANGDVPYLMKHYIDNPNFMCTEEQIKIFIKDFENALKNELKILI